MNQPLKIFFFGTPEIAVPSLNQLHQDPKVEIIGVGVFPDRPVGRKQILQPCPVKIAALERALPIYEIPDKKTLKAVTSQIEYDLAIVIAFGLIFPASVLKTPTVNVHFSLLPAYRGASPVQAAILDGLSETGITWQRMVKALDAGDILRQDTYDITGKSTLEIWNEFAEHTAKKFPDFIADYLADKITPLPQLESEATFCGKFTRADGFIEPSIETAESIYRKYLAFDPWPGIYMNYQDKRLKIHKCSLTESENSFPLKCAKDTVCFLEVVQLEGKTKQPASNFFKHE